MLNTEAVFVWVLECVVDWLLADAARQSFGSLVGYEFAPVAT